MIHRIRSRLTFANVISLAALFVALGGTATAVTYVVSSNSQIGPGTISGHRPPSGDHPNIISGSINGQDVQNLAFHNVAMKNGWSGNCGSGGNPAVAESAEGVVYFRGTMCRTSGSSANPFAVPAALAPSKAVFIPVDEAGSNYTGAIVVNTNGEVSVNDDPSFSGSAAVGTSLAGASYTLPF
jgi:hypothetical protein